MPLDRILYYEAEIFSKIQKNNGRIWVQILFYVFDVS